MRGFTTPSGVCRVRLRRVRRVARGYGASVRVAFRAPPCLLRSRRPRRRSRRAAAAPARVALLVLRVSVLLFFRHRARFEGARVRSVERARRRMRGPRARYEPSAGRDSVCLPIRDPTRTFHQKVFGGVITFLFGIAPDSVLTKRMRRILTAKQWVFRTLRHAPTSRTQTCLWIL